MSALPHGLKVYIEYKDVRLDATVNQTPKGLRFDLSDRGGRTAITAWHLIGYFRKHYVPGMTCADPMLWICISSGFCQDFTLYSVLRQSYLKNSMAMLGSEEVDDGESDDSDDETDTDSVPESWLDDDVSLTSEEEYQLLHEDD